MRTGAKIFIALLLLLIVALVLGPPLLGLFFGAGFDP